LVSSPSSVVTWRGWPRRIRRQCLRVPRSTYVDTRSISSPEVPRQELSHELQVPGRRGALSALRIDQAGTHGRGRRACGAVENLY
jgi:hypothetical protein